MNLELNGPEDEQRVGSSINEKRPLMEIGSQAQSLLAKKQQAKERTKKIKQATEVAMKFIDKNNSKALSSHLLTISQEIKMNELID